MNLTTHQRKIFESTSHLNRVERIRQLRERLGIGMMDAKHLIDMEELDARISAVKTHDDIREALRGLYNMILNGRG